MLAAAWLAAAPSASFAAGPIERLPAVRPIVLPTVAEDECQPLACPPDAQPASETATTSKSPRRYRPQPVVLIAGEDNEELAESPSALRQVSHRQATETKVVFRAKHVAQDVADQDELRQLEAELEESDAPVEPQPEATPADESDEPVEAVPAPVATSAVATANEFGLKPLSQLTTNIQLPQTEDGVPADVAAPRFAREGVIASAEWVGRDWALTDYQWEASMLCHGPILFEQLNAERYGITYGYAQPLVSGAHFFATIPAIPYKVWAQGHDTCQYALGYYRPGSPAQPQCYRPRISADAGLFQAGVIVGLIFILP